MSTRDRFPVLAEIIGGYLHEDFGDEYRGAREAIAAYAADVAGPGDDEQTRAAIEARSFLAVAATLSTDRLIETWCDELGSAWQPEGLADLWRALAPLAVRG